MKARKLFALVTAILLMASLSINAFAVEWNLAQQGALNIAKDGDYIITSTDKAGKQTSTNNTITIANNIQATITLNNVAIDSQDSHGIQVGSGSDITLNLIGLNSILNDPDKGLPVIENKNSNLTITSASGGTLKLQKEEPKIADNTITFNIDDLPSMLNRGGNQFVVVMNGNNDGYVIADKDSILPTEVIADESVPLAPSADALSTITIEGNAQVDAGRDIYKGSDSYVIGMDTIINGIPGWDIETLANYIPYEKDYSNLILVASGQQLDNCRILKNKSTNISVIASDSDGKVKLTEDKLKNKNLTDGVDSDAVLRTCHLSLNEDYNKNFVVRFHLGEQYAGKTVEIRSMINNQMVTETITIGESGIAAITASASGDFALIEK